MKQTRMIAIMLGTFLLSAMPAKAEVRITIPFDFSVGKVSLPSGTYSVTRTGAAHSLLQLCHKQGKGDAVATINSIQSNREALSDKDKLVFHRYGNQYFLAQFWTQGSSVGFELPTSEAERQISERLPEPTTEILTASSR
jgi:hypothetical protein